MPNLPEGLEQIGCRAFYGCQNLEHVTIPASIQQIGNSAFEGTPWIKSIGSEYGVRYIANVAYNYDYSYMPESDTFTFRDGTIAISDGFLFPSAVKEKVKALQLPESLIEIGNNVFSQFKVLGEVKLPSSLKRIGQQAFAECPKFWCTLPESLETLEYQAFLGCMTLSQATLPENLHYIGGEVFRESAVGTIYVNSKDLHYQFLDWEMGSPESIFGEHSSLKKAIIGPQVTRLYDRMFGMTSSLNSVEFLDPERSQLTYIGDNCFSGCATYMTDYHLTIKNLPSSIKHIGNNAFPACTLPTLLNLTNIKYLGSNSFSYSDGVERVVIPESVDTIGSEVFSHCKDLRHVEFNAMNYTTIPDNSGDHYPSIYIFAYCDSLKTVTIGANVTNIPRSMFGVCRNLESVEFLTDNTISTSPLTIHDYAFSWCRKLTSLILPERVDSIGGYFITGTDITTFSVPASCKYLGKYVFDNWIPLESLYFNSEIPPTFGGPISDRSWEYAKELTIYVPKRAYELYKNESDLSRYNLTWIPIKAESITLSHDSWTAQVGERLELTATVLPDDATNKILSWSSSDKNVAYVDRQGHVKAISVGDAVITATCDDVSATCNVTVLPTFAESITLSLNSWTAHAGETVQLTANILPENTTDKTVVWYSSDESVATVDADGKVTAVAIDEAIISATCGDVSAACTVTVLPIIAESITLSQDSWIAHAGETVQLTANILPENTTDKTIVWYSSDESVATVDADGKVTAIAIGEAIIYATCRDVSATCTVTVNPILAESLIIDPKAWRGEEGSEFTIKAIILPENATYKNLVFESSDTTIATVENDGHVTVLKEGLCTITVSTTDGSNLKAECEITSLSGIEIIFADSDSEVDVYDMNGIMLKHACTQEQIKHLSPGAYIIRSGTVVVKIIIR